MSLSSLARMVMVETIMMMMTIMVIDDVNNDTPEEPDETKQLGKAEDTKGSPSVEKLEAREPVLCRVLDRRQDNHCFHINFVTDYTMPLGCPS